MRPGWVPRAAAPRYQPCPNCSRERRSATSCRTSTTGQARDLLLRELDRQVTAREAELAAAEGHTVDAVHGEWALALGRGMDEGDSKHALQGARLLAFVVAAFLPTTHWAVLFGGRPGSGSRSKVRRRVYPMAPMTVMGYDLIADDGGGR